MTKLAMMLFDVAANAMAPRKGPTRSERSTQRRGSQEQHSDYAKVIAWECTCGSTRRELISSKYGSLFRQLASEYPISHYDNTPTQLDRLSVPQIPSNSSLGDSSSSADTQSSDGLDSTDGGSSRASVSTAPSSTGSTAITLDFDTHAFVHLLVRAADRYVLSSINVTGKDARSFFLDLIIHYRQHRGSLRRFLSIFVYSHCDFVKVDTRGPCKAKSVMTDNNQVKHHRANRFSPIPGFSFPELGRDVEYPEYTYSPQPMIQAPVTRHMFNDYFYSCYDRHNLKHSFVHKFLSSCDVIDMLPQDLLENMPKRDREVIPGAKFSKVEHFWGVVAREQRSAVRVVVYMLLSLAPTIWFAFMWLFSWGHEGDLQTATVPVTISIATLSMVWAVVYSGGEMGDTWT